MKPTSLFLLLLFYLICFTLSAQTTSETENIIEFKKIKNGKQSFCNTGNDIQLVTIYSDSVVTGTIKDIDTSSFIILEIKIGKEKELRRYQLNEIKKIEKETFLYTAATISVGSFLGIGSLFFVNGFTNNTTYEYTSECYTVGAACYAIGVLTAIPTFALHKVYRINITYYASIKSVKKEAKCNIHAP